MISKKQPNSYASMYAMAGPATLSPLKLYSVATQLCAGEELSPAYYSSVVTQLRNSNKSAPQIKGAFLLELLRRLELLTSDCW